MVRRLRVGSQDSQSVVIRLGAYNVSIVLGAWQSKGGTAEAEGKVIEWQRGEVKRNQMPEKLTKCLLKQRVTDTSLLPGLKLQAF